MVPWPIAQPFISTKGTFKSPLGSGNTICIYHSKRKGLRLALMKFGGSASCYSDCNVDIWSQSMTLYWLTTFFLNERLTTILLRVVGRWSIPLFHDGVFWEILTELQFSRICFATTISTGI
ncbi:hypothetical protein SORBI_3007G160050 [Sorghum bicolor]|uniref:Uncharacterized protein n=1 Tax=Sorghum bicolor TaxID=4558 RepID=A0A1Z5RB96_SORBI|nr:hypothetical protein SORBI_3007G160050 [Sorghum bicolor]